MAKVTKDTQFKMLNCAINRGTDYDLPKFSHRYYVVELPDGSREILREVHDGVVAHHKLDGLRSDILRYCRKEVSGNMIFNKITDAVAKEAALDWFYSTDPIEPPMPVMFHDDVGLCYHRLPFAYTPNVLNPLFDELMSRTSDPMALKCFIGSLFHEDADLQQYVWMFGDGRNGKGTLHRFLKKLMGPAYIARVPPGRDDRFWTSTLIGKRLVGLPDCKDSSFPTSGLFKMLSGGDDVPVERKGQSGYSTKLNCKFIFSSNDKPNITSQLSDTRRAIYIELTPIGVEPDGDYEDELWKEAPGIVDLCLDAYYEMVGIKHGSIPIDSEQLDNLIDENEEEWEGVYNIYFDEEDEETRNKKPIQDQMNFSGQQLLTLFQDLYNGQYKNKYKIFIKWLRTAKQITRRTVTIEHPTMYNGMKTRTAKRYVGAKRNNTIKMRKNSTEERLDEICANMAKVEDSKKDE